VAEAASFNTCRIRGVRFGACSEHAWSKRCGHELGRYPLWSQRYGLKKGQSGAPSCSLKPIACCAINQV
jgi:hypothetical protein